MIMRILAALLATAMFLAACDTGSDRDMDRDTTYADQMAEQHAGDSPVATALATEPTLPVEWSTVTYGVAGDADIQGYMAAPENPDSVAEALGGSSGNLPGLIIIHEWWGLNENIQLMTRRFAGEGFRVLAVDLYGGQVASTPDGAQAAMQAATENPEALDENIRAAYQFLTEQHGVEDVAVLGWCFGGTMALRSAVLLPTHLDAAVIYYGRLDDVEREHLETIDMPMLAFFGSEDESIPLESVRQFERTMDDLGKDAEVHVYEGAGHAFANPSGENFVEDAARETWDRTAAFLREHLYGQPELRDTSVE